MVPFVHFVEAGYFAIERSEEYPVEGRFAAVLAQIVLRDSERQRRYEVREKQKLVATTRVQMLTWSEVLEHARERHKCDAMPEKHCCSASVRQYIAAVAVG